MRGKASHYTGGSIECRITPAYAGKSQCNTISAKNKKDHPRLCGEKSSITTDFARPPGSPPPMRGKDFKGILSDFLYRITPAYAGKSLQPETALQI